MNDPSTREATGEIATGPVTVVLLRHGEAVPAHPDGDRARPLAPGATGALAAVAERIAAHGPARALVSPARRTRETLNAVAPFLPGIEATHEEAIYEAAPDVLLGVIERAGAGPLLLVGHNPGITAAAQAMSGGAYTGAMRPGDAVVVEWNAAGRTGRLIEAIRAPAGPARGA